MLSPNIERIRILALPSWYPNKLDSFLGDFIKRHVEAISLFHNQHVIFIVKDESGLLTKNVLHTRTQCKNYTEEIIYYHIKKTGVDAIDKFLSDRMYLKLYKKSLKSYIRAHGLPSICHVHIALKAGLAALWLKKNFKVPFMISEHWSGYLPEASVRFADHNMIFQSRTRKVFLNSVRVSTVSQYLAENIERLFPATNPIVIPNVVDTELFHPIIKPANNQIVLLHASTMNYPKNIEKILEALLILKSSNHDFKMQFFGPEQPGVKTLITKMKLEEQVSLEGNVSQDILAGAMQKADALIQFSRFETFGCVVIEANAAGIPVFVSDIPALCELITDGINGFVIKADDSSALAVKLMAFIDGNLPFDKNYASANSQKFSYDAVGKRFSEIYSEINTP